MTGLYDDQLVTHDGHGLALSRAGVVLSQITWPEVLRATAFKRDLLTTDLICLRFDLASSSFEINEEVPGWESLLEVLHHYLPGARLRAEWWNEVTSPAFESCETGVFDRLADRAV